MTLAALVIIAFWIDIFTRAMLGERFSVDGPAAVASFAMIAVALLRAMQP